MKFIKELLGIIGISIFTSCVSYRYIDLQILNPGSSKIPSNISLHIEEPEKMDSDHLLSFRDSAINKKYYYKLLVQTFDSTLKARFIESPMFEQSKAVVQKESDLDKEMGRMPSSEMNKHVSLSVRKMEVIEKKPQVGYNNWDFSYTASYSYTYRFRIEMQNIGTEHYYDTSTITDTLTWEAESYYKEMLSDQLPTRREAITDIATMAAEKYARKVAPYWTTEERMLYYSNNKYMRKGYNLYLVNDLDGAIQSWKHLYEVGTPQLASIAAHNIALIYEILDDFDNSELWLDNSIKSKYHYQTVDYYYRIKERKAGRKKLDEEMN